jgi:hypothetical protein
VRIAEVQVQEQRPGSLLLICYGRCAPLAPSTCAADTDPKEEIALPRLRSSTAAAVLAGSIGLILGMALFTLLESSPPKHRGQPAEASGSTPSPVGSKVPERSDATSDRTTERDVTRAPVAVDTPPDDPASGLGRYSDDWIAAEVQQGWQSVFEEAMPAAEHAAGIDASHASMSDVPYRIGRGLALERESERLLAEEAEDLDALQVLKRLTASNSKPPARLVTDREHFERYFEPHAVGPARAGEDLPRSGEPEIAAGSTLQFPAGVHPLHLLPASRSGLAADVTVAGQGRNATLLVLDSALSVREDLERLTLRDCTVHTADHYLLDLRGGTRCVLRLVRVRVIGFDMGAGASAAISSKATILQAVDSAFEGGYGRNPGSGQLLDVRTDVLMGRFDGCLFSRIAIEHHRDGVMVFSNCRFEDMLGPSPESDRLIFQDCNYARREVRQDQEADRASLRRDLHELFPGWDRR